MKKIKTNIILVIFLLFILPNCVYAKEFKDVTKNGGYSWIYESLNILSDKEVFGGYPDGTFKPERPVSFLEIMQVIKNIKNPNEEELAMNRWEYENQVIKFNVPEWALNSVCYNLANSTITFETLKVASERGFLNDLNTVYPNRNSVTVYFARAFKFSNSGNQILLRHKDQYNISDLTKGYLASLIDAGIYSSTGSDGYFNGKSKIRRAEVAVIANRFLNYLSDKEEQNYKKIEDIRSHIEYIKHLDNNDDLIIGLNSKDYIIHKKNIILTIQNEVYNGNFKNLVNKRVSAKVRGNEVLSISILEDMKNDGIN